MKRPIWRSKWFVPVSAVTLGILAAAMHMGRSMNTAEGNTRPSGAASALASAPDESRVVTGEVLETLAVANYTYLRIRTDGGTESWAAVPATKVAIHTRVRVRDAELMKDFSSPTLHRTFASIYFGTLDGPHQGSAGPGQPDPHAFAGNAVPHPTALGSAENWHDPKAIGRVSGTEIVVGKVKKAEGASGTTVSDLRAKRQQLTGQSVRVRGVVVKAVTGVLDRTFVHVRDGSGRADGVEDDLTITTADNPETGKTLLFEGVVATDRDFGSGYRYDVIVESARVVAD